MDQRLHGIIIQEASNSSELTEPVETRHTDTGNVIIQAHVRRNSLTAARNRLWVVAPSMLTGHQQEPMRQQQ